MHLDALRSTEIQSGVLIIKGLATQHKAKNKIQDKIIPFKKPALSLSQPLESSFEIGANSNDKTISTHNLLIPYIAYQLFLDHG